MQLNKGRGITCRPVQFPPFPIPNEDSQSSCIHRAPCMIIILSDAASGGSVPGPYDNILIYLFVVSRCEANFSAHPPL